MAEPQLPSLLPVVVPRGQQSPMIPVLYDATGTEIPLSGTPPTGDYVVTEGYWNRYRDYPSKDLTPMKLASILDAADAGDPRQLIQLEEEILEKDSKTGSVFQLRSAAVLSTPREYVAADDSPEAAAIADWMQHMLDGINFEEMLANQLDAIPKPFAVTWIEWGVTPDGFNYPCKFTGLNQRFFRWAPNEDVLLFQPDPMDANYGTPLAPYTTVRSMYRARRDHPTRAGLLRPIVWLYLFKMFAMKDWASWTDRYGMPIRTLKIAREDFLNPRLFTEVRASLRRLGSDASGIFPNDSTLEVMSPITGEPVFKAWIEYIDTAVAQAVLGHELSSQGGRGQGGTYGVSAAKEVRHDILSADCEMLSADVYRDILVPMVGFNFGWDKIHLTPQLYFEYELPVDQQQTANVYATIAKSFPDLPWSRQQLRETFNIDTPTDIVEDETDSILPAKTAAPGFGIGDPNAPGADPSGTPVPGGTPPAAEWRRIASTAGSPMTRQHQILRNRSQRTRRRLSLGQGVLNKLGDKAVDASRAEIVAFRKPIETLVARAVDEDWAPGKLVVELARLYPKLGIAKTRQKALETFALSRLYGHVNGTRRGKA